MKTHSPMNRRAFFFAVLTLAVASSFSHSAGSESEVIAGYQHSLKGSTGPAAEVSRNAARLDIPFISNQGQVDQRVEFYAPTSVGTVFVTRGGEIVYSLRPEQDMNGRSIRSARSTLVLRETLVGGKLDRISGEGEAITKVNYFKGNDPSKWKTDIATFDAVSLGEVYKGVELKLKAHGNSVEKRFFVKPGAQPERIKLKLSGGQLTVNRQGELEIKNRGPRGSRPITFTRPVAFQEHRGKREFVEVAYAVEGDEYGFSVGAYDTTKPLVIDPAIKSTFLGGGATDEALAIAVRGGFVYVGGITFSPDFPSSSGGLQTGADAFIAKLNPDLSSILKVALLGGGSTARGLFAGSDGNVYMAGDTGSSEFPILGTPADATRVSGEGVVAVLDTNLVLRRSTFLGGDGEDLATAITLDTNGNVYVAGFTNSADFPGAAGLSGTAAFVAKLNPTLSAVRSTLVNGNSDDSATAIVFDDNQDAVYVAGFTNSTEFPGIKASSADSQTSGAEGFITKLGSALTLLGSTFLGGDGADFAEALALDTVGQSVYIAGATFFSSDFPGVGTASADRTPTGRGGFISRVNLGLSQIVRSTFLDGAAKAIAFRGTNVYVAGIGGSRSFNGIGPGSPDSLTDGQDAFAAHLDPALAAIRSATFLGGTGSGTGDVAQAIALGAAGIVYVTGKTDSADFPGIAGADRSFGGDLEGFVARLETCFGAIVSLTGTPAADALRGTAFRDVIHGFGGSDRIAGLDGNDDICGGNGDDKLAGDNGLDALFGEKDNDDLNGGLGSDRCDGGSQNLLGARPGDAAVGCEVTTGIEILSP